MRLSSEVFSDEENTVTAKLRRNCEAALHRWVWWVVDWRKKVRVWWNEKLKCEKVKTLTRFVDWDLRMKIEQRWTRGFGKRCGFTFFSFMLFFFLNLNDVVLIRFVKINNTSNNFCEFELNYEIVSKVVLLFFLNKPVVPIKRSIFKIQIKFRDIFYNHLIQPYLSLFIN